MNDFQQCLKDSHAAEDMPFWKEVYTTAFPNMVAMPNHREDGDHQRQGIDRSIILSNGKQLWIDEKVRKDDYGDIAIEYISNDVYQTPGWACKPLLSDYIAYAILPRHTCYLLPVPQLQLAWINKKTEWLQRFGTKKAQNKTYNTLFCPVSIDVLFSAIGACLRIGFKKIEEDETPEQQKTGMVQNKYCDIDNIDPYLF